MLSKFYVFGFHISSYWTIMFAGFLFMQFLMSDRRRIYELSRKQSICFIFLLMAAGLVGCKLLFMLENWKVFVEDGITLGGFSFFGAVFLIPIFMCCVRKKFDLDTLQVLNACAPCVVLMLAVIRLGCFFNGCCGGVYITGYSIRWPTQIMESLCDILILQKLLNIEKRKTGANLYSSFLIYYGCIRFMIEFLRDTDKNWFGLSHGQWFSIISVIVGICWNIYGSKIKRQRGDYEEIYFK